jgi:hypothetical protein
VTDPQRASYEKSPDRERRIVPALAERRPVRQRGDAIVVPWASGAGGLEYREEMMGCRLPDGAAGTRAS